VWDLLTPRVHDRIKEASTPSPKIFKSEEIGLWNPSVNHHLTRNVVRGDLGERKDLGARIGESPIH
jgi:hypothetical protein